MKKVFAFSGNEIRRFLAEGYRILTIEYTDTGCSATLIKG